MVDEVGARRLVARNPCTAQLVRVTKTADGVPSGGPAATLPVRSTSPRLSHHCAKRGVVAPRRRGELRASGALGGSH